MAPASGKDFLYRIMNHPLLNKPSRLLGHYEVISDVALESGRPQSCGEIGLVCDTRDDRKVLLRYLPEKFFSTNDIFRFQNQMRQLAKIQTPAFSRPLDFGQKEGVIFCTQEALPHPLLTEYFSNSERSSLNLDQVLDLAHNLLRVLEQIHQKGCVFGTLQASSIFYDGHRAVLSCPGPQDFLQQPAGDEPALSFAEYASPELAGSIDQDVGPSSDLYSFGVLLYRVLTGYVPYQGSSVGDIILQHLTTQPHFDWNDLKIPTVLRKIIARLLKKEPRDRYQSASAVLNDIEFLIQARHQGKVLDDFVVGRADSRTSIIEPALVGRSAELGRLKDALEAVRSGASQVASVTSPSGMGKSRLIHELLRDATSQGFRIYRGMATNQAGQLPMAPLLNIARQFALYVAANQGQKPRLHRELADFREEISTILPEFARELGWSTKQLVGPDELGANRVNRAVANVLFRVGTKQAPALIWLDDCQWLDSRSLDILQTIQSDRLNHTLLVLSWRPNEGVSDKVCKQIERQTQVALQPLKLDELRALVESMAGILPDMAVQTITTLSAGSPFMASAILRGMVESGALVANENQWRVERDKLADIRASEDAADALLKRLEQVPSSILNQLSMAAIIGKEFDGHTLIELTGMSFEETQANFDWCRRQRLIWAMRSGSYSFAHDSIRETLIRRLNDTQRRELNQKFAQQLERNEPLRWFEIACHYDAAGKARKALPFALKAAAEARQQYSLTAAEELFRIASRGLDSGVESERHHVESGLADVLMLQGKYDDADQWFVRASVSAHHPLDKARTALNRGELEFKRGNKEKAVSFFEEAINELGYKIPSGGLNLGIQLGRQVLVQTLHSLLPKWFVNRRSSCSRTEKLTLQIFSKLAYGYWYTHGKYRTFWAHLAEMNLAELYPPSLELAQAYSEHAPGMSLIPWHSRGIQYVRRSLKMRQQFNDVWGQGQSRNFYSILLYSSSQYEACIDQAQQAESILVRTGDPWEMNMARYQRAAALYRVGNLEGALKLAKSTYESALSIGDFQTTGNIIDVWVRASMGQLPEEVIQLERSRTLRDCQCQCQVLLAEGVNLFHQNEYSRAAKCFVSAIKRAKRAGVVNAYITPNYAWLASALRMELESKPLKSKTARRRAIHKILQAAKRAVRVSRRFKNDLPHALRELAAAFALSGEKKRVKKLLLQSLSVAGNQKAAYEMALTRQMVGAIGQELGWSEAKEMAAAGALELEALSRSVSEADQQTSISLVDRFDTLLSSGREIASSMHREQILKKTLEAARGLLRGQRTLVIQTNSNGQSILAGPADQEFDSELVNEAMVSRKTVVRDFENVDQHGVRSKNTGGFLCSPITVNDRAVACIYVANDFLKGLYGGNEIRIADYLTSAAGAALEKANGFEQLAELNQTLEQKVLDRTATVEARSRELEITADELRKVQTDLEVARDEAEAANSAKSSFLARISHEIRTPISAVIGFTELMLRGVVTDPQDQANKLETIHASGNHLLQLINDLLDISKIEAGKMEVESIPCEPVQVIRDVFATLEARSNQKAIDLRLQIEGEVPRSIVSDPTRMRQIFTNLIGNAIKFTEVGMISATLSFESLTDQMLVEISDTGIGMTENQLEKIFEPFTQADSSTTRKFGGTGLGLSISKRLVETLGGSMSVKSRPGIGSRFVIKLPIGRMAESEWVNNDCLLPSEQARRDKAWSAVQLQGLRALVVDDSETNRELLRIVLGEAGAVVEIAENGRQAMEQLKGNDSVDVVLMDMQMPVLDGYGATQQLRKQGFDRPIIALTANSMIGDEGRCLAAGCTDYVSKPINFDVLLEKLGALQGTPARQAKHLSPTPALQPSAETLPAEQIEQDILQTIEALRYPAEEPFRSLSIQFIEKVKGKLPELAAAIQNEDFETLGQLAHWIKGTGGTVGLPQLSEISIQMESALKGRSIDEVVAHYERLRGMILSS